MKYKGIVVYLIIASILSFGSFADHVLEEKDHFVFEYIGSDKGLKDLSVSSIIQDKNGYIWFATQGGLFKYNGRDTQSFRNDPFETNGLPNNLIQTTYYDPNEHVLWLGTYSGLSRFDINTLEFTNYSSDNSSLSNNVIVAIQPDKAGNIWIGTMNGLNRLDVNSGSIVNYSVPGDVVRSICLDSKNRIIIGTYEGICVYDEADNTIIPVEMDYPSKYVMVIKEFQPGELTIGMWDGGVMRLDLDFNILEKMTFADNRVYTLLRTENGILWAGTWGGGLFAYDGNHTIHFPGKNIPGDIGHDVVYSMLEDAEGVLWIGTNGNGVYRLDLTRDSYLKLYNDPNDPNSLDGGKINTIFRDSNDNFWIAIYNKGLNRFDKSTGKIVRYNTSNSERQRLFNDQIMDMIEFNGELIAATGEGIALYEAETDNFKKMPLFSDNKIIYALEEDNENHLWVGTYIEGVYHFDENLNLLEQISSKSDFNKLKDDLIYDILADRSNRIWIATNNGLYSYDKGQKSLNGYFKKQGNQKAIASNSTRALLEDKSGRIWIGTSGGGLALYNDEDDSFESFTEKDGLLSNTVISIKEGDDGKIWVATRSGMSIVDPESKAITNLSEKEGLGGSDYTGNGFKDADGTMYFGGTHGIDFIPSKAAVESKTFPPVYITNLSVFNKPLEVETRILNGYTFNLEADQNYLSFDFEVLDYSDISKYHYEYYLKNIDTDWIESGRGNRASYPNIPPGQYEFLVRVTNIQGINSDPVSIMFTIAVPWYKTIYAYFAYFIMVLALMYGAVKIRKGHLMSKRNSELAKLNDQLNKAVDELEAVSVKDPLTGCFNRRYFNNVFEEYLRLAKRSDSCITLMMIDFDNFKDINDERGHLFGDGMLKAFVDKVELILPRSTDFLSRFGGDEFAIVLYDTEQEGAEKVVNRLRDAVKKLEVTLDNVSVTVNGSVSIGVYTAVPSHDNNMDQYIEQADKMLYRAKSNGKSRVEYFTEK